MGSRGVSLCRRRDRNPVVGIAGFKRNHLLDTKIKHLSADHYVRSPSRCKCKDLVFAMSKSCNSNLLEEIIADSCEQVEKLLSFHDADSEALKRRRLDLEMSPLLNKQMMAMALRLASELCLSGGITQIALKRFQSTLPAVAIDAQRRLIESEVYDKGLPMELAGDYADRLEQQIDPDIDRLPEALWAYAGLYEGLWCDPRIYARTPTRRIMLAMATVLRARSAQLTAARNRTSNVTGNLSLAGPRSRGEAI